MFFSFTSHDVPYSFDDLMGKEVCDSDPSFLDRMRHQYETGIQKLNEVKSQILIPKVIHFIWLGPKGFPLESVDNIRSWMAHHPDWTIKFWTDEARLLPCNGMEVHVVENFKFLKLKPIYDQAESWAEKAQIWSYEILFQEGGLFVDPRAYCLSSFDTLHTSFEFYAGLEASLSLGTGVIGACPNHPILKRTIDFLIEKSSAPLTLAVRENMGPRDIIFPTAYFYPQGKMPHLLSFHYSDAARRKTTQIGSPFLSQKYEISIYKRAFKEQQQYYLPLLLISSMLLIGLAAQYYLLRKDEHL